MRPACSRARPAPGRRPPASSTRWREARAAARQAELASDAHARAAEARAVADRLAELELEARAGETPGARAIREQLGLPERDRARDHAAALAALEAARVAGRPVSLDEVTAAVEASRALVGPAPLPAASPIAPLQKNTRRSAVATAEARALPVAKRDKAHKLTIQDDLAAIARVASRGDSEQRIVEALIRSRMPCSAGHWHSVKVHRRVGRMRCELGITTPSMRAGDTVVRWRSVAESTAKRKIAVSEAVVPDAQVDFSSERLDDF